MRNEAPIPATYATTESLPFQSVPTARCSRDGAQMLSVTQLYCELQRDWQRKDTLEAFLPLFVDMTGSAGVAAAEE
jgi:hypothetical protein